MRASVQEDLPFAREEDGGERRPRTGRGNEALSEARPRHVIEAWIASRLEVPVRVTFTDNGRVMLSARRRDDVLEVRLHHMFSYAGDEVLGALAQHFRRRTRRASAVLDAFVRASEHRIRLAPRAVRLETVGAHHDLGVMFEAINREWFEGKVEARIGWGTAPQVRGRRRSIRLGTFSARGRIIRIHPLLDQAFVPDYVVRTVVFHEMLHAVLGPARQGSKLVFHTREFRDRERAFPDHARATAWEEANLHRLLTGCPKPRRRLSPLL